MYAVIFIGLFNIITYSIYLARNGKTEKRRDGDTETQRNGETEKRKEKNTSVSITRAPGHLEFFLCKTCSRFAPPKNRKNQNYDFYRVCGGRAPGRATKIGGKPDPALLPNSARTPTKVNSDWGIYIYIYTYIYIYIYIYTYRYIYIHICV